MEFADLSSSTKEMAAPRKSARRGKSPAESPFERLSTRERGLRAAKDVLSGKLTEAEASRTWGVIRESVCYYRKKLNPAGFEATRDETSPNTAAADARPASSSATMSVSKKSEAWEDYSKAFKLAGELTKKVGKKQAAAVASAKYGLRISSSTALRAARSEGAPPIKAGRKLIIHPELPIFRFMIINYVNVLVKGTEIAEKLKHKEVQRHWYYNWLSRCQRLKTANIKPLEITRAKWATPENVLKHYEMLEEMML
ncbi:MAG: hypothetical protein SGPRY_011715 [Prymnesium sp.]